MDSKPIAGTEDRRWSLAAGLIVAGVLAFSLTVGLVVLPIAQAPNADLTAWQAICRAIGISPGTPAQRQPTTTSTAVPVSQVRWSPRTLRILSGADPRPAAALAADVCSSCHGEEGYSPEPENPHIAGQSAEAIYKQLSDYRSGARAHKKMTEVAQELKPDQLAQVAAYFASYNKRQALGRRFEFPDEALSRLAHRGDPARGIPPCESCHQPGSGGPPETPIIKGQQSAYITAQLRMFRTEERRNDVYRRMRDIAQRLTEAEVEGFGEYYQAFP